MRSCIPNAVGITTDTEFFFSHVEKRLSLWIIITQNHVIEQSPSLNLQYLIKHCLNRGKKESTQTNQRINSKEQ